MLECAWRVSNVLKMERAGRGGGRREGRAEASSDSFDLKLCPNPDTMKGARTKYLHADGKKQIQTLSLPLNTHVRTHEIQTASFINEMMSMHARLQICHDRQMSGTNKVQQGGEQSDDYKTRRRERVRVGEAERR